MQQYRVNYSLLIGLVVGTLVASGAAYGLWRFQLGRNAGSLITSAQKAEEAGDIREAASSYSNYLSIRPNDREVRVKLAQLWEKITDLPDVQPEEVGRAINLLETTVRAMPEEKDLQRTLVELYGRVGANEQAIDHAGIMVSKYPDDVELQVKYMENLMRGRKIEGPDGAIVRGKRLVGYDDKADTFDEKKAVAPHNASVYGNLAAMIRGALEDEELADRVMEQLVKVNPDSSEAYLQRGQYLVSIGEPDRGQRDIERAYRLAPDDPNVILTMALRAQANENMDQAREFFNRGNKEFPKDARFYQGLAGLEVKEKNYDEALATIAKGIKEVSRNDAQNLLFYKAELQFLSSDVEGARATAEEMKEAGFRQEFVDWVNARILLAEGKWFDASRALQRLPQNFINQFGIVDDINNQLGLCYERLGQLDRALNRYQIVLQRNPGNEPAKMGEQRIKAMRGISEPVAGQDVNLDERIQEILQKPKAEQDWTRIDEELKKLAEAQKLEGAMLELFWARIKMMRQDFAGARKHLIAGRNLEPENLQIRRAAVTLLRADPNEGPEKATRLLDQTVEKFGDLPGLRLDRADIYLTINEKEPNEEQIKLQLDSLAEPAEGWNDNQKMELWNGLAGRFLGLKMQPEATKYLERVADLRPDELPTRMALFALALESNDDAGMLAAQEKILEIVDSKNDSNWLYTEARRQLSQYRRGQLDKESLAQIRDVTEQALDQRPDWFELHLVKAEIELLDGNEPAALQEFDVAAKLGKPSSAAILQHVRLLLNVGRVEHVQRARQLIEQLPKTVRENDLGHLYAEVLFNLGDMEEAVVIGERFVAAAPDNAERNLRYGQLLARFGISPDVPEERRKELLQKAGESLQKSVELGPESAEAWLALLTFNVLQQNEAGAIAAIQQAQLALPEDQLTGVLAKAYEIMGGRSWFDAETMYLTIYSANPDNLRLAQQLAIFYLSPGYPVPDKAEKAAPLVNKVLHAGADGTLEPNDPTLLWARRAGAELLSSTRDYQQLLKAQKLLASNSSDGELPAADRLLMARILAGRPEPESREKAMQILEQVQQVQQLSLEYELILGQLYFALGDTYWDKCKKQMLQAVTRFPKDANARASFIEMLTRHGDPTDYNMAAAQLARFRELAPNDVRTVQFTVQLAAKTGKVDDAKNYLRQLLPKVDNPQQISEQQLSIMEFVAGMLGSIGDLDSSETIYRQVVARDPRKALALAEFLGTHRNVDESMKLLEQSFKPENAETVSRVAISVVRARRDEVNDKYDANIAAWLDRALLENPDSIPLLMLQAEFDDVRKEYDGAAATYQKLLARDDLTGVSRAVVLNNLAFLVALAGSEAETGVDPLKSIQEAEKILGPTADILDTRAVVYVSQNQPQKAIRDLEYAVTDNPTPSKYFHKAVAHLAAGENKAAVESWEKAESLGDVRATLNRMEYEQFDQVKSKIDALRTSNPKLTETDRLRAAG